MPIPLLVLEDKETDDDDVDFDFNCNVDVVPTGFGKMCVEGFDKTTLEQHGWGYKKTTGQNSLIFQKGNLVLKIVKQDTLFRNEFCEGVPTFLHRFWRLQKRLKEFAPHVIFVNPCKYANGESRMAIVMQHAGELRPKVLPTAIQLHDLVMRLVATHVFSTDIVSDDGKINYGNILFKENSMTIIDTDDLDKFVSTKHVDFEIMYQVWTYTLIHCLFDRRVVMPLPLHEKLISMSTPQ